MMHGNSNIKYYSIIAVTNKHTAKLHHVGSLYILTYDARKLKHNYCIFPPDGTGCFPYCPDRLSGPRVLQIKA